jgi:hypothetical protein
VPSLSAGEARKRSAAARASIQPIFDAGRASPTSADRRGRRRQALVAET